jgi:hypothetical protein
MTPPKNSEISVKSVWTGLALGAGLALYWPIVRALRRLILSKRVRDAVRQTSSRPRAILIAAEKGHVTLSGSVSSREVDRVLRNVATIKGVSEIENQLDVEGTS